MEVNGSARSSDHVPLIHMPLLGFFCYTVIITLMTSAVIRILRSWWRLRHVPGPSWASLTNLQRMWWVYSREAHLHHQRAHARYGDVVRIGPNMVAISNPEDIPTVYPMRTGFVKGDFYATLRPYTKDTGAMLAVFNTQDEEMHRRIKSPIAPLFSLSNVIRFEALVEQVLHTLDAQLENLFAEPDQICNLGDWLQFFAFDVMGTLTFSRKYGFLDHGHDVDGMLSTIFAYMKASAMWTQIPWLDFYVNKNALVHYFYKTPGMSILATVSKIIHERLAVKEQGEDKPTDFLSHYLSIRQKDPNVPLWAPKAWVFSNIIAGSDSVGTVMQTVMCMYRPLPFPATTPQSESNTGPSKVNLLSNPRSADRLLHELLSASVSLPYPKWSEVRNLPYLDACVNEGLRLHPPFALPFERVVPSGGIVVSDVYLPAGTVVGGNPYVINRNRALFGEDVEDWRPERWLDRNVKAQRVLSQSMLTRPKFGAGRRVCLGKHVAILELKKLVPFLLVTYDMQIVHAEAHTVENAWFFKHKGIAARIKKREVPRQ